MTPAQLYMLSEAHAKANDPEAAKQDKRAEAKPGALRQFANLKQR